MSFGKSERLGKSVLDVTSESLKYSDIKKGGGRGRDPISDFQSEPTSGIVFPWHTRLILLSCLENQPNLWYVF